MTPEGPWEQVAHKFGGQPPAWAHQAYQMWQDQPAKIFKEWLVEVDGSEVSIYTGQHLQG